MRTALFVMGLGIVIGSPLTAQVPPSSGVTARAELKSSKGETVGSARLTETPAGVLMQVELTAAETGVHAFHIHQTGKCDPPKFDSAGSHYSPGASQHGFLSAKGPHAGDLPNIHVPAGGRFAFEVVVPGVTLGPGDRSLFDQDGSALVLHQNPDDYSSQPAGNAGDRIACGVIMR